MRVGLRSEASPQVIVSPHTYMIHIAHPSSSWRARHYTIPVLANKWFSLLSLFRFSINQYYFNYKHRMSIAPSLGGLARTINQSSTAAGHLSSTQCDHLRPQSPGGLLIYSLSKRASQLTRSHGGQLHNQSPANDTKHHSTHYSITSSAKVAVIHTSQTVSQSVSQPLTHSPRAASPALSGRAS